MLSLLKGRSSAIHPVDYPIGRELFARRSLRRGDWKIVYEPYSKLLEPRTDGIKAGVWLLFNLKSDPAELDDVAASHPALVRELSHAWDLYARDNGVIIPETFELYQ
jgi:arylsulfatase